MERFRAFFREDDADEDPLGPGAESLLRILIRLRALAGEQPLSPDLAEAPPLVAAALPPRPAPFALRRDSVRVVPSPSLSQLCFAFDASQACRVSVAFDGFAFPAPQPPADFAEGGRGLTHAAPLPPPSPAPELAATVTIALPPGAPCDPQAVRAERTSLAVVVGGGGGGESVRCGATTFVLGDGSEFCAEEFFASAHCLVCFDALADTACVPCRHLCLCAACADLLRESSPVCPVCRSAVSVLLRCFPPQPQEQEQRRPSAEGTVAELPQV